MTTITVDDIQQDLASYLIRVQAGETLLVTQAGRPVAEINPVKSAEPEGLPLTPRPRGLAKGDFVVPDDFDDPLPDEIQRLFEGTMKLLLDTHIFLWYITEDDRLNAVWDQMITDPRNQVFLSVVSFWELIIKSRTGKLPLPEAPEIYVPKRRNQHRIISLSVDELDVAYVASLPSIHNDPFDRLLIAQALRHGLTLLTVDTKVRAYPNLSLL